MATDANAGGRIGEWERTDGPERIQGKSLAAASSTNGGWGA